MRYMMIVCLLCLASLVSAQETEPVPIVVDSAEVVAQSDTSITLEISGSLGTGCQIDAQTDYQITDGTLTIEISQPVPVDVFCPMMLIPYNDTLTIELTEPVTQVIINNRPLFDTPITAQSVQPETHTVQHLISNASLRLTEDGWMLDVIGFMTDSCTEYEPQITQALEDNHLLVNIYREIPDNVNCASVVIDYEESILIEVDLAHLAIESQIGQIWFPNPNFVIEVNDYIGTFSPVSSVDTLVLIQTERDLLNVDSVSVEDGNVIVSGEFDLTCGYPVFSHWMLEDHQFTALIYRAKPATIHACDNQPEAAQVIISAGLADGNYDYAINETSTGTLEVSSLDRVLHVVEAVRSDVTDAGIELTISGYLPDGCEASTQSRVDVESDIITVTLYRQVPPGVMCPANIIWFEETVSLGEIAPGDYTLQINNYETTLTVE